MSKANKKKSDFLGLNYSTAAYKLRKAVLFSLVRETNRDICFRCGGRICSAGELGFDHKEPWLGVSKKRFWDLGNIAFSHTRCNTADRPWNAGKARCKNGHKFTKSNTYVDPRGYRHCIICKRKRNRASMRRKRA